MNQWLKGKIAPEIRKLDLNLISMDLLGRWCQKFGLSGRGTRHELMKRLREEIWKHEYDA